MVLLTIAVHRVGRHVEGMLLLQAKRRGEREVVTTMSQTWRSAEPRELCSIYRFTKTFSNAVPDSKSCVT